MEKEENQNKTDIDQNQELKKEYSKSKENLNSESNQEENQETNNEAKELTPEIAERAAVLSNLKKQIATAKVNAQRAATIKAQEKIEEGN